MSRKKAYWLFLISDTRTQEVNISGKTNVKVVLKEDTEVLDEVVVVGYGAQKKASLTSSISQIKGDEAFKNKGIANATVALQGEVPGLTITRTSTRPGSEGAEMKIRGDISVNGKSSPLVIIDGITGSLDELNAMDASDIENISVLKDASAAIYGARSASGVVLVTTKRGKKERLKYHIVVQLVVQLMVFSPLSQIIRNGWICFMKLNITMLPL